MHPKEHIIYSTIFSIIIYLILEISFINVVIIWISSWLIIDLDHAIRYSVKTKNISPMKFWKWSIKETNKWKKVPKKEYNKYKMPLFIFHGIEPLLIVLLLSVFWKIFLFVFIGLLFHMILDLIDVFIRRKHILGKVSIIYVLKNNSKRKTLK